ncbi:MAG: hypothetical protein K2Q01_08930 [Rickettsiales bacterium]|nr:hypothetical protein [Rickettsiales bacterium]
MAQPRVGDLRQSQIDAMAKGGEVARRAFEAMMDMGKIDVAKIEAAVRGKAA